MTLPGNDSKWWSVSIIILVLSAAAYILSESLADPDLWGHVLFGQDIIRDGEIARVDPYSYLSGDHRWINHEWLTEVVLGTVYSHLGPSGLILLKLAVAMTIVGLAYRHMMRGGLDVLRAGIVLVVAILLLIPGLITIRPQMFTFLCFTLLLLALERYERGGRGAFWAVPLLFMVWVNFHGGVLAGLGVLFLWTGAHVLEMFRAAEGLDERAASQRRAAGSVLLAATSAAATLINPYGWKLPAFLIRTGTVARPDIVEWQPLEVTSAPGIVYLLLVAFGLATLARSTATRRTAPLLVLGVVTLLPLTAVRHIQLFSLAYVLLLPAHLASAWGGRREAGQESGTALRSRPGQAWLIGAVIGLAALLLVGSVPRLTCIRLDPHRSVTEPTRAIGLLARSGLEANVAIFFDWGEYAIWHLQPGVQVSMDGRRETVYPDSIYADDLSFRSGTGEWDRVVDRPETDLALVPSSEPAANLLKLKPGWTLLYQDSVGSLFGRADSELARRLRAVEPPDLPVDGTGLCFP